MSLLTDLEAYGVKVTRVAGNLEMVGLEKVIEEVVRPRSYVNRIGSR